MNVAFVLVSYRADAPAGMERATAAAVQGLRLAGHHAFVLVADGPSVTHDDDLVVLDSLTLPDRCDDAALRHAATVADGLGAELTRRLAPVDLVVRVDALWGLGAWAPPAGARSVLMVHVLGTDLADLHAALARTPDAVIAVSDSVVTTARRRGVRADGWKVVPNALLAPLTPAPDRATRERLRTDGPIRLVARLGAEKGIAPFLRAAASHRQRTIQIVIAAAGFELYDGSQAAVRADIQAAAAGCDHIRLGPALPWRDVPPFFADAALAIVPSARESFGLVALEAMSAGTPVVCFAVDNLPALVADAGMLVAPQRGPSGLTDAMNAMLGDPDAYLAAAQAARATAERHHPASIARQLLKAAT